MKCDICNKEFTFLYFIGRSNVCNKCIAKHTVFKEVRHSEDELLRKAMRAFDIKSFDDLRKITDDQLDELAMGMVKEKKVKTFKYKKNAGPVKIDGGDYLDAQTELDMEF
ncbi:hypothetical protein JXC34_01970 [Candidatus Woesearchaeota archaeon]|nr:hypothetical protein [Candidatus Woesearchaeota archaeon]